MTQTNETLKHTEAQFATDNTAPATVFAAAHAAQQSGNTEKATRYLRMAFSNYDTAFMNALEPKDIKQHGDTNRA